jgi:hypothetical protein
MLAFTDWSSTGTHYQVRYFLMLHYQSLGLRVKKDTVALSKLYKKVCKQATTGHTRCVNNTTLVIKHYLFDRNFWGG